MCVTRVCRPPHPNGILSPTIQTGRALFSINTTLTAIHMHLIRQFVYKQSTFQSVKGQNRRIKFRSGDGSHHLGMWWTIVLHISWSTVSQRMSYEQMAKFRHIRGSAASDEQTTERPRDDWLLISLKDSNIPATVTIKTVMFIKLHLVWTIRSIWWIGCFDLILGMWPDLTWPNCLYNPELTLPGRCSVNALPRELNYRKHVIQFHDL